MSANRRRRSSFLCANSATIERQHKRRSASAASAIAAATAATAATSATSAAVEAIATAPSKEQLSLPIAGGSASADEDLLEMPRICRCCCKRDLKLLGLFEASQPTLANTTVASASVSAAAAAAASASVASNKSSGTLAKTCATEAEAETETPQTLSANPVNPGTKATSSPSEAATTLSAATPSASTSASTYTATSPMRRRTTNTTAPSAPPAPRGRSSDNAVDYTLSGAHSSMDIVLEEMTIWMLNLRSSPAQQLSSSAAH